jgi:hypothetical protein
VRPCGVCRELGRHTYVTPTSYLELIYTYKELLGQQRAAVQQLRRRYEVCTAGSSLCMHFLHRFMFPTACSSYTAARSCSYFCNMYLRRVIVCALIACVFALLVTSTSH